MNATEKEARRLVSGLLTQEGYFDGAMHVVSGGFWAKLPGLVALVESLLKQDKFVPPADPDELAVFELGKHFKYYPAHLNLEQVKKSWSISFGEQLQVYRAGKAASCG